MRISKKKISLVTFLAILIFLCFIVFSGYINTSQVTEDDTLPTSQDNSEETIAEDSTSPTDQDNSEETFFVIPESPTGTLGLISASAAAFATFTIIKKKQRSL